MLRIDPFPEQKPGKENTRNKIQPRYGIKNRATNDK